MTPEYDVIVVGAGPAGATAAHDLTEGGARTLVLERGCLPRYKTCAGGIPLRTAALLPFDISPVVEDTVDRMAVSRLGRPQYLRHAGAPYAHMAMRDRFDALLVQRAAQAGASVADGVTVRALGADPAGWRVETDRGAFVARHVIGADGTNSVVARATGLGRGLAESVAMEAEVEAPAAALDAWRATVGIDLGYRPWGYGWVFPKADLLSVGLVLPVALGGRIRGMLETYRRRAGLSDAPLARLTGHKVLFRRGPTPITGDGVALVGDAAGLADEFSEEGIYYAVRSGQLAAAAVLAADISRYQAAIDGEIQPELDAARAIADLFYASMARWPGLVMAVTNYVDYLWSALFRVQRGESTYDRELDRTGPLPRLLRPLVLSRFPDPLGVRS